MPSQLTATIAEHFATITLGHVRREYPSKLTHKLASPADARTPSALYPIFYGSNDWHSCVHGYWLLARLLKRFPHGPQAPAIDALFTQQITPEKVAGECAYLAPDTARGFERPYGWAWLLKLSAELATLPQTHWAEILAPLTKAFVHRLQDFLPLATYPVRVGTHFNTAFALRMATDYAHQAQDSGLIRLLQDTARRWYGGDTDCPAWGEPSGDDFLSPALIEAECMRGLLPGPDWVAWFDRFLPQLTRQQPATLFQPVTVSDRSDGKIAHLDGLNLSRAWCLRTLARALPDTDPRPAVMRRAAEHHLQVSLPHLTTDYMGEHWLPSFALLALEA